MPPIARGLFRARKKWIDDALGSAARCRRAALRQRGVAALVIVAPPVVHMQANRISRIVRLSPSWRRRQNRRERQNRQSRNAHRSSSVPAPAGSSDRNQTGPFVPGQFTFARSRRALGRAPYRFVRRDVRHVQEHLRGAKGFRLAVTAGKLRNREAATDCGGAARASDKNGGCRWSKCDAFCFGFRRFDRPVYFCRRCKGAQVQTATCHRSSQPRRDRPSWVVQVSRLSAHTCGGE